MTGACQSDHEDAGDVPDHPAGGGGQLPGGV